MKTLTAIVLCLALSASLGFSQLDSGENYFSQVITTPDKTLNFNLFVFHEKYRWVESKTEGNYSTISLVIQNQNKEQAIKWEDYKIFLLLKDGTLFHNYTTVAKTGNFMCSYEVAPGGQHVQMICFGKKFKPEDVERAWLRMTHSNFIRLLYNSKTFTRENFQPEAESTRQE